MTPCGKYWYASKEEADAKVLEMKSKSKTVKPESLDSYFCEECEGYHVGHDYLFYVTHLCVGECK